MTIKIEIPQENHPREDLRLGLTSRFFRILGDPTRLRVLELLLDGEKTVTQLVEAIGYPQGRISSHLACLRWCGFIETRRDGKHIHYRLADRRVQDILATARAMLSDNADRVLACQIVQ